MKEIVIPVIYNEWRKLKGCFVLGDKVNIVKYSEKQGCFNANVDQVLTKINMAPHPTGDRSAILTDPGPYHFEGHGGMAKWKKGISETEQGI